MDMNRELTWLFQLLPTIYLDFPFRIQFYGKAASEIKASQGRRVFIFKCLSTLNIASL